MRAPQLPSKIPHRGTLPRPVPRIEPGSAACRRNLLPTPAPATTYKRRATLRRQVPATTCCPAGALCCPAPPGTTPAPSAARRHLLPRRCPLLLALLVSVARSAARSSGASAACAPCCPRATSRIRGQVTQICGVGRVFGGQALFLPVGHAPPSGARAHLPYRRRPGPHPPHQLAHAFPASKRAPYPRPSSPSATRSSSPSAHRATSPSSYPIHRWGSHSKCHRVPAKGQCHRSVDHWGLPTSQ
jgi:hypothetical protein